MNHKNYLNFDLLIYRAADSYAARVTSSPIESKGRVSFDLSLDNLPTYEWSAADIQAYGENLFNQVFADDVGKSLLLNFQEARRQEHGLRIRLCLDKDLPELAVVPWELLYSKDWQRAVTNSLLTPIVRYIEGVQDAKPLQISLPLRILVVVAEPKDREELDAEVEWNNLKKAMSQLTKDGTVYLEKLEHPTIKKLQERLTADDLHILHFIGHGYFDENVGDNKDEGGLILENEQGKSEKLSAEKLALLLHDKSKLRLVFLNVCEGSASAGDDYFAGTAQKLIQQEVPAVVAMQFPVSDKAAICLSEYFYKTLALGFPLDAALSEARKAVTLQVNNGLAIEWATPALFSRSPNNQLFTVSDSLDPAEELPFALHELFDLASQLSLSGKEFFAHYRQSLPAMVTPKAEANLRAILHDLWSLPNQSSLHNFVQALIDTADAAPLADELTDWLERQKPPPPLPASQLSATQPTNKDTLFDPCLQVEIRSDPQTLPTTSPAKYLLRISLWSKGEEINWCDEHQAITLDEIRTLLRTELEKENHLLPAHAAFEFIAPRQLFTESVDEWETSEEFGLPCGQNYPVVIRSLDRLISPPTTKAKFLEKWQSKWQSFCDVIHEGTESRLHWSPPDVDFKKLGSDLDAKAKAGVVGLSGVPATADTFKALLIAGIPVALWPKKDALSEADLQTLRTKHLSAEPLAKLPRWLLEGRSKATDVSAKFALLWDDPTRIPTRYRDEGVLS